MSTSMKSGDATALYLDLLKMALMDVLQSGRQQSVPLASMQEASWKLGLLQLVDRLLRHKGFFIARSMPMDMDDRMRGRGLWPQRAQTMIGMDRLNNIQRCIESVIDDGVPGDVIETGVWRGGATIFMRGVLKAHEIADRTVWVADSFEGLPKPDESRYPADRGDTYFTKKELAVSLEEVQEHFRRYGLLDDQVKFLKGWFRDTLPNAPIAKLAVLRLDGDMYESTMDALTSLYPKLSVGGYVIVDDYRWIEACRQAVTDYRRARSIADEIIEVDWTAIYWRKSAQGQ